MRLNFSDWQYVFTNRSGKGNGHCKDRSLLAGSKNQDIFSSVSRYCLYGKPLAKKPFSRGSALRDGVAQSCVVTAQPGREA